MSDRGSSGADRPVVASRVALGTTAFAGMLAAPALGVFFVPTRYAIVQRMKERFVKAGGSSSDATPAPAPTPG
jgi:hypothetical protein